MYEYVIERELITKLQADKLKAWAKRQRSFLESHIVERIKGRFDVEFIFSEAVKPSESL